MATTRRLAPWLLAVLVYLFPPPNPGEDAGVVHGKIIAPGTGIGRQLERTPTETGTHQTTIIIHPTLTTQGVTPAVLPAPWTYGNGVTVTALPLTDGRQIPVTIVVLPSGAPLTGPEQATIRSLLKP